MESDAAAVQEALDELRGYANDLRGANPQTFENTLRRYMDRLDGEPLGKVVAQALPKVEFEPWYEAALSTQGAMGAQPLDWPSPLRERVALQSELLRRMAAGEIASTNHFFAFHSIGHGFDSYLADFVEQTLVPFHRDLSRILYNEIQGGGPVATARRPGDFVDKTRLDELRVIETKTFDLRKLIALCEELDRCYRAECYHAVAALTRSLIDHVPPIFRCANFGGVANNYAGSRSFKESMRHLEESARKIGDAHLHTQIRRRETLPTRTQVDFSSDLDVLLAEVVRILK